MGTLVWGMRARGKRALGMMARGKWAWGIAAWGTLEKRPRRPVQRELKPVIQVERKSKMNIARNKPFFFKSYSETYFVLRLFFYLHVVALEVGTELCLLNVSLLAYILVGEKKSSLGWVNSCLL
jgi:hypothetical protein